MTKIRFLLDDIAVYSDELENASDARGFYYEARRPLEEFGITLQGNSLVLETGYASVLGALAGMQYIVERANHILELVTEDIMVVIDIKVACSALQYYNKFLCDQGDDTAFDYHNTYVQIVLDSLVKVLANGCALCI